MVLVLDPDVEQAHRPVTANTPVNHVAIESALTANAIRDTLPFPPPISASASASSSAVCAANRNSGTPAAVATQGFSRTTTTWPTRCSSALMRWLIADGVTWSRAAAASNDPCSITAAKAANC